MRNPTPIGKPQHRDDVALNRPDDVEPGGTRAEPAEALANSEIQHVEPGGTRAGTRRFCGKV